MIYAIQAIGTQFIKFGKASSVGKRLAELEVACPFELNIIAVANWPDGAESAIHKHLDAHRERGEWFRDCDQVQQLIGWMINDSFEHLRDGIADAIEKQLAQRKSRKSSARRLSIAPAREQRTAWWDSPAGIKAAKAAQQIDNELDNTR